MYRAIGFALLVGLGLVTFILAAPPAPQPPVKAPAAAPASTEKAAPGAASAEKATAATKPSAAPEAAKWIDSLASRDFRTREQATRAIIAIGTPALPALRQARSVQDAEVRQRVDELVAMLERAAALAPKRVTLKIDKKPVKDVLNEIAKQTGFKIPTTDAAFNAPPAKAPQSFEFKNTPFWEALDKVCEKYGLIVQQTGNADTTMRLAFQDSYEPYRSYDGSFKVLATGFSYNRNNNFGEVMKTPYQPGEAANESLQINFSVCVEPRVPIMKVGSVRLIRAEDENKCSMLAEGANYWEAWNMRYYGGGNNRSFVYPASAYLAWPSKTSRTLKVVKGIIPVTLLAEQKLVVVTDNVLNAKGKKIKVGPATFNIDSINTTGNKQQEIKITYNEDSTDMNYDWGRIQAVQQRLELQDAKGNKIPSRVQIYNYNPPNGAQLSIIAQPAGNNSKVGPPAKLLFQLWVQMEHEVAFEFHDLPLP
jgi:hypothetical protein